MEAANVRIVQATSADELAAIRRLFLEYAEFLGEPLDFQGFDEELRGLPGKYAPPAGSLLLARHGEHAAGCVALRALGTGVCEMKRMYVRPEFRGRGVGLALARRVIEEATTAGYASMRLDTIPSKLPEASRLYRGLGFIEIPAYYDNPIPGVAYFELKLRWAPGEDSSLGSE